MKGQTTILCPVDFGDSSTAGLDAAVLLAERIGARILFVHIVPPVPVAGLPYASPSLGLPEMEDRLAESAEDALNELIAENVPEHIETTSVVTTGDSIEKILEIAREENVSMVVVSRGYQAQWMPSSFCSVAQKITGTSCCPVLVVPSSGPNKGDSTSFIRLLGRREPVTEV